MGPRFTIEDDVTASPAYRVQLKSTCHVYRWKWAHYRKESTLTSGTHSGATGAICIVFLAAPNWAFVLSEEGGRLHTRATHRRVAQPDSQRRGDAPADFRGQ